MHPSSKGSFQAFRQSSSSPSHWIRCWGLWPSFAACSFERLSSRPVLLRRCLACPVRSVSTPSPFSLKALRHKDGNGVVLCLSTFVLVLLSSPCVILSHSVSPLLVLCPLAPRSLFPHYPLHVVLTVLLCAFLHPTPEPGCHRPLFQPLQIRQTGMDVPGIVLWDWKKECRHARRCDRLRRRVYRKQPQASAADRALKVRVRMNRRLNTIGVLQWRILSHESPAMEHDMNVQC